MGCHLQEQLILINYHCLNHCFEHKFLEAYLSMLKATTFSNKKQYDRYDSYRILKI